MENLTEKLMEKIGRQVRAAELLVSQPHIQARQSQAAIVRRYLIGIIFYGDRVLAELRDGADCNKHMDYMEQCEAWAHDALVFLKKGCHCDPQDLDRR